MPGNRQGIQKILEGVNITSANRLSMSIGVGLGLAQGVAFR